jgi:large subunit ribosomal protein L21
MYAVFQLAGVQFTAEEGTVLKVPSQRVEVGNTIDIDTVLLARDNDHTFVGTPHVDGAKVEAEVLSHGLSDKVRVYKLKRRTKYRRTRGHRQPYSEIRINKITVPGE